MPHQTLPSVVRSPTGQRHRIGAVPVKLSEITNEAIKGTPLDELFDGLARFAYDPYGFVMWAFPWGEVGTPLEHESGPEPWQREHLERVGDALLAGAPLPVEEDTASGHGVGKSSAVAWVILWAISTHEDTRGVVTANTDTQLRTKTWAELAKWYQLFIGKSLFTLTATAIFIANDPVREKAWRIDAVPWSENNTEAFAGLHNKGKRILVLFDEASTIADLVWEVTRGALTDADTQIIWCRYGNPTRTSGEFHRACTRPNHNPYHHFTEVDARQVRFTNKIQIAAWIKEYGEDSDFVRVRVLGKFPRAGSANFISPGLVTEARRRRLPMNSYIASPKILACDPARFGDDATVITLRQGNIVHWQEKMSGYDGHQVAGRLFEMLTGDINKPRHERRDAQGSICIAYDANGNGADLDTALRNMSKAGRLTVPLVPVMWGVPAKDDRQYFNQRSEAWGKMRDFLEHGQIPDDDQLAEELSSLEYGYDALFRIQLESKKDAKKRGVSSPDCADSIAISFVPELIDRKVVTARVRPVTQRKVVWTGVRA